MHPSRPLPSTRSLFSHRKSPFLLRFPFSVRLCTIVRAESQQDTGLDSQAKFTYKQIKALPIAVLREELRQRCLPAIGRKAQVANRLYTKLAEEGRVLGSEEAAVVDAQLSDDWSDEQDDVESDVITRSRSDPLLALQKSVTGSFITEKEEERLVSNAQGLQIFFLGVGLRCPNGLPVATSTAIRTQRSLWLFDCGEDTQRAVMGHPLIEWKRMDRIFISSLSPDCILGIPGMLCTIGASRLRGHENADIPIHIYGPQGIVQFVNAMMTVSHTYLEMPVIIHEFIPRALTPKQEKCLQEPILVNKRSMLYAVALPPDQLNPYGYYNGELTTMLSRHTVKKQSGGMDDRSGVLPMEIPPPGDPSKTVPVSEMTWTIRADAEFTITAAALRHKTPCFGYLLKEARRAGKLFPDKAVALGLQIGSHELALLKSGIPVKTPKGTMIYPEEVVGPPRRGRRMAVIGPCHDSTACAHAFAAEKNSFDILVHAVATPQGEATSTDGASMATVAGNCANILQPKELILWQQQSSLLGDEADDVDYPARALEEAKSAFHDSSEEDPCISFAGTYSLHQVERDPAMMPGDHSPGFVSSSS